MTLDELVEALEQKIYETINLPGQTRKYQLNNLIKKHSTNTTQSIIANSIIGMIADVQYLHSQKEKELQRVDNIPKRLPLPNPNDELDHLIYTRFLFSYFNFYKATTGSLTKKAIEKCAKPNRYIDYCLKHAHVANLGKENFINLCRAGCPQGTHEWLFTHELKHLVTDTAVIAESERLLKQYGY